jgi:butyryl-CoA dehydrogenase
MLRDFAREQLAPKAAEWDRTSHFPREELRALGELGVLRHGGARAWGGAGIDYVSLALALEEIAAGDGAVSTIVSVQNSVVCGPINAFGTDAQKEKYLVPLASGERLGCFCLTEPHVGSDAAAITTRAVRDGDHWVLNGVKQFITTGKHARRGDRVRGDRSGAPARRASRRSSSRPTRPGTSWRGSRTSWASARRTPRRSCSRTAACRRRTCSAREGEGYRIALANLEAGRIGIAAQAVGMARAAFDAALRYAHERELRQADRRAPGGQFPLADMATEIEVARQMVWHAAALRDAGEALPQGGVDGEALRLRDGRAVCSARSRCTAATATSADFPGRAHLPRRPRLPDLRGRATSSAS